jgi:hypothetical protein
MLTKMKIIFFATALSYIKEAAFVGQLKPSIKRNTKCEDCSSLEIEPILVA